MSNKLPVTQAAQRHWCDALDLKTTTARRFDGIWRPIWTLAAWVTQRGGSAEESIAGDQGSEAQWNCSGTWLTHLDLAKRSGCAKSNGEKADRPYWNYPTIIWSGRWCGRTRWLAAKASQCKQGQRRAGSWGFLFNVIGWWWLCCLCLWYFPIFPFLGRIQHWIRPEGSHIRSPGWRSRRRAPGPNKRPHWAQEGSKEDQHSGEFRQGQGSNI